MGGAVRLRLVLNRHPSFQKHLLEAGVPAVTLWVALTSTTRWHCCSSQQPWVKQLLEDVGRCWQPGKGWGQEVGIPAPSAVLGFNCQSIL